MRSKDEELIKGVLRGDKVWLRRFQQRYRKRLLNFVLQKVGDYQDAEEILQDTLVSAIYSLPSFLGRASLWSWLCSIAKHEIADFYRKKKIKEIVFSRLPRIEAIVSEALSPELALEEKQMKEKIIHCFLELTEGYREILRQKYIEGLSVRQIACQGQRSVKAVEMRLRRARLAFRKLWYEEKAYQKDLASLSKGDLSFLKEYLGTIGSPLSDTESHQD
ncbi:RNA polymerase sigma factor [Patescibacteria group bacterium]|nr:RNA polymerase sigma factor [Patescibacteria group bacterium]